MRKYDLSKTEDLMHELSRMCKTASTCGDCGLKDGCIRCEDINEIIRVVAKWSEENPEKVLTRRERAFIEEIDIRENEYHIKEYHIKKSENGASIESRVWGACLNLPFESIPVGKSVPISELLTWEVSDE